MSRSFTHKPCPGCGLNVAIAPGTVCRKCQDAIRDYPRVKTAAEAVEGAAFYSLSQGIHPKQASHLTSCVDFEASFLDLLEALCASKPKAEVGFNRDLDHPYSGPGLGQRLPEARSFMATGLHSGSSTTRDPGVLGAINRVFHAIDGLINQSRAEGQIKGQDLLGQLNSGALSMAGLDQKTRDAERVIQGR
jgi:hypothetical protein